MTSFIETLPGFSQHLKDTGGNGESILAEQETPRRMRIHVAGLLWLPYPPGMQPSYFLVTKRDMDRVER